MHYGPTDWEIQEHCVHVSETSLLFLLQTLVPYSSTTTKNFNSRDYFVLINSASSGPLLHHLKTNHVIQDLEQWQR